MTEEVTILRSLNQGGWDGRSDTFLYRLTDFLASDIWTN